LDDLHDNLKSAKSFGFNPMYVNLQNGKFNNKTYADNVENEIKKNLLIETIIIQKIGKSVREAFVVNTDSFDLFDNGELY
jgi:formiminotetrahydrofolate cyclodeaminase